MIANSSFGLGLLSRIQAHFPAWHRQTVLRPRARIVPNGCVERGPGAAARLALRTHWIVVVFLVGMGLLLRFGN